LQTLGVEPLHVEREQLLDFARCEPSLAFLGQAIAHEVGGFLKRIHDSWRNCVKPVRLTTHHNRCNDKHTRSGNSCKEDKHQ
jgi:hypothetical protein